jgi:hypothetical protein
LAGFDFPVVVLSEKGELALVAATPTFDFFQEAPVVVEVSTAQLSSDAGLLPFRYPRD